MELQTLQKLLSNKIIRIPDYQRGYSWEKKHLDALWSDIENSSNQNIHFLGIITLKNIVGSDLTSLKIEIDDQNANWLESDSETYLNIDYTSNKLVHIVDGQQRITSLMILLKVISNKYKELNKESKAQQIDNNYLVTMDNLTNKIYKFGYCANIPCYNWYKANILEDSNFKNIELDETFYTQRLKETKRYFDEKLNYFNQSRIDSLVVKIETSLKFQIYELDRELEVSLVFETMNRRGKQLSNLEILKNRLIHLVKVKKLDLTGTLHLMIIDTWKEIYFNLGKDAKKILDDDEFLRAHWIMYFEHSQRKETDFKKYEEHLFDIFFTQNNKDLGKETIENYCKNLSLSVVLWCKFKLCDFNEEWSEDLSVWCAKLNRLATHYGKFFEPLILALLNQLYNSNGIEVLVKAFKDIERHNFLVYYVSFHNSNQNRTFFYKEANNVFSLKSKAIKYGDKKNVITEKTAGSLRFGRFEQELLYLTDNGFYEWRGTIYLLSEYESSLNKSFQYDQHVINCIYPNQNGCNWEGIDSTENSQEIRRRLRNTLGNLILTDRRSITHYNANYEQRCSFQLGSRNIGLAYGMENEKEIVNNGKWNKEDILFRTKKLLDFFIERWSVDLSNTADEKLIQRAFLI